MHDPSLVAVMVHVPNVAEGLAWYERAFSSAVRARVVEPEFEYLVVGKTRIERRFMALETEVHRVKRGRGRTQATSALENEDKGKETA